jgi:hypothetical protein
VAGVTARVTVEPRKMVALAVLVGSAKLRAINVIAWGVLIVAGAVYTPLTVATAVMEVLSKVEVAVATVIVPIAGMVDHVIPGTFVPWIVA